MNLSPSEYNTLDIDQKANLLWSYGQLLDERIEYSKFRVCIYYMGGFYVELSYSVKDNSIRRIKALEKSTDWKGFLNSVDLEALLN